MPSFVSGGTFSASLDKWDILTINGPGTLQVIVGLAPQFETLTFGLQKLGPYAQTAVITGVMTGTGNYVVGPSNTAVGLNVVDISAAQLASPTAAMATVKILTKLQGLDSGGVESLTRRSAPK